MSKQSHAELAQTRPGSLVNGAGIVASDSPATVVEKLDQAFYRDSRPSRESADALEKQVDSMAAKLRKVATWLDRLAESSENSAKDCRFGSLVEAYKGDARNYRTTAADIRSVLPKAKQVAE